MYSDIFRLLLTSNKMCWVCLKMRDSQFVAMLIGKLMKNDGIWEFQTWRQPQRSILGSCSYVPSSKVG